jgi:hypothetical protein
MPHSGQNNFRKNYYSSLGVKAVEVQPSLESALSGDVLNFEKLKKLCLWVRIPHLYRPLVWKVLLGSLPPYKATWEFVQEQKSEEFKEILRCIRLLNPSTGSDQSTDKDADDLTPAFLLKCCMLSIHPESDPDLLFQKIKQIEIEPRLMFVSTAFLEISESQQEAFSLLRSFLKKFQVPFESNSMLNQYTEKMTDRMIQLLMENDSTILDKLNALDVNLRETCALYALSIDLVYKSFKLKFENSGGLSAISRMCCHRKRWRGT